MGSPARYGTNLAMICRLRPCPLITNKLESRTTGNESGKSSTNKPIERPQIFALVYGCSACYGTGHQPTFQAALVARAGIGRD